LTYDSLGFATYYAVEGINYAPPPLPEIELLDVPYLPVVILNAAGLPLSDASARGSDSLRSAMGATPTVSRAVRSSPSIAA
jgi:hypothetical protein